MGLETQLETMEYWNRRTVGFKRKKCFSVLPNTPILHHSKTAASSFGFGL